jgi:hypothetical protein
VRNRFGSMEQGMKILRSKLELYKLMSFERTE